MNNENRLTSTKYQELNRIIRDTVREREREIRRAEQLAYMI